MAYRKVKLTLQYSAKRDQISMNFRYHPEFLEKWKALVAPGERKWDAAASRWWFDPELLWSKMEWLGQEFGFETEWSPDELD